MNDASEPTPDLRPYLQAILAQLAQVLPAQPPLRHFTHQNPLQGCQNLPFRQALTAAAALPSSNGYLPETKFRELYQQGHINDADIEIALQQDAALQSHDILLPTTPVITKADVYRLAMLFELEPVLPNQLAWQIEELNTLEKFQPDIPLAIKQRLLGSKADMTVEKKLIADLWQLLLNKLDLEQTYLHPENMLDLSLDQAEALLAQHKASQKKVSLKKATMHESMQEAAVKTFAMELQRLGKDMSLRNLMMDLCGVDILDNVRPQMIRLCSSGLDEGMAAWQLPERSDVGLYVAWRAVASFDINPFLQELPNWQAIIAELPDNAENAIMQQINRVEIPQAQWEGYLRCLALEIPGWSCLINWRAQHPDYRPKNDARPTLADYLAVRLTLDRLWLNQICRDTWQIEATLSNLKTYFRKNASEYIVRRHLFRGDLPEYLIQQAETMALSMGKEQYDRNDWQNLADIIWTWQGSSMTNSRPVHSIYDSAWLLFRLSQHLGLSAAHLQAISKSMLEQTLNVLSEFTVAQRGHTWLVAYERHYREALLQRLLEHPPQRSALPNANLLTAQLIFTMDNRTEGLRRLLEASDCGLETLGVVGFLAASTLAAGSSTDNRPLKLKLRQTLGRLWHHTLRGNLLLSPLLMVLVFPFTLMGLLTKVFCPRWQAIFFANLHKLWAAPLESTTACTVSMPASLSQSSDPDPEPIAQLVRLLQTIGLTRNLSPLIVFIGHTPSIQNNSHFAAYTLAAHVQQDGASAAAIAALANRSEVRALLAKHGINIPADTWFVGAEYDSTHENIAWFHLETLPAELLPSFKKLQAACLRALQQSAQERCKEFTFAPQNPSGHQSLRFIQTRAADIAEQHPNPAYAFAAAAVIGRRTLTQKLKLERSVFLVSYDPMQDSNGQHLETLLLAVVPTLTALNLSYYFAIVDNQAFGSGNSILHNIIGQLGIMEGAGSDLRYGLPDQMTERHAAMRLQLVVEASITALQHLFERQPKLQQLVQNGWLHLNTRDPETGELFNFSQEGQFVPWQPDDCPLSTFVHAASYFVPSPTATSSLAQDLEHG